MKKRIYKKYLTMNPQFASMLYLDGKISYAKVKEAENEVLDYLLDNWESTDTEVKINYLRLLVKKYYEERVKCL